jgi:hypothetical protein
MAEQTPEELGRMTERLRELNVILGTVSSTREPHKFSQRAIDLAWDAALASNIAWDRVNKAEEEYERASFWAPVTDSALEAFDEKWHEIRNFELLKKMAGLVMKDPDCPFAETKPYESQKAMQDDMNCLIMEL